MRVAIALVLTLAARAAGATPVVVDRENLQQQVQLLQQELSGLQQQLGRSPNAPLLNAMQAQLGQLQALFAQAPYSGGREVVVAPPPPDYQPIDDASLGQVIEAMNAEAFSDGKIRVVRAAAGGNYFVVAQLVRLVNALTFSKDKVRAVELVAPRLLDKQNAFQLYEAFTFSADKKRVQQIIGR